MKRTPSWPLRYGVAEVVDPVSESLPFGPGGTITLAQPTAVMRAQQTQVVGVVVLLVGFSVSVGAGCPSRPMREWTSR